MFVLGRKISTPKRIFPTVNAPGKCCKEDYGVANWLLQLTKNPLPIEQAKAWNMSTRQLTRFLDYATTSSLSVTVLGRLERVRHVAHFKFKSTQRWKR
jgi:hypothetical protein